jgi:26-hydroxylase
MVPLSFNLPTYITILICSFSLALLPSGAVHNDPKLFDNPEVFKPERFVRDEEKFHNDKKVIIYFGTGEKRCVGKILGRAETFLFTAAIVQTYKWEPEPGGAPPTLNIGRV